MRVLHGRPAIPGDASDDLGHHLRMCLPQGAVDLNVAIVPVGLISDQRVRAQQAAKTAAIGAGGRQVFLLVNDQTGQHALPLEDGAQRVEQFVVREMSAARIDDLTGAQEQRLLDDGRIGTLGADPHLARVHHAALLQLEGHLVEDIVPDVFLVCQHLMDGCARPRSVKIGAVSFGVQDLRDRALRAPLNHKHCVHALNDPLFLLGAGHEDHAVGLQALLLAAR